MYSQRGSTYDGGRVYQQGYPPQQQGYRGSTGYGMPPPPPQQGYGAGYPPPQQMYAPQPIPPYGGGYPPQHGGYGNRGSTGYIQPNPAYGGGYPPQQRYPPPQQVGYPPQQGGYTHRGSTGYAPSPHQGYQQGPSLDHIRKVTGMTNAEQSKYNDKNLHRDKRHPIDRASAMKAEGLRRASTAQQLQLDGRNGAHSRSANDVLDRPRVESVEHVDESHDKRRASTTVDIVDAKHVLDDYSSDEEQTTRFGPPVYFVDVAPNATDENKVATAARAHQLARILYFSCFSKGDFVTWKGSDDEIPAGTFGTVSKVWNDGSNDIECLFRGTPYTFNPERLNKVWGAGAKAGDKDKRKARRLKKRQELRANVLALRDGKPPPSQDEPNSPNSSKKVNRPKKDPSKTKNKNHTFYKPATNADDWRNKPMLDKNRQQARASSLPKPKPPPRYTTNTSARSR